ncbi:MAG: hypothetical protein ACLFTK_03045 [Anaerolineales bacterium]
MSMMLEPSDDRVTLGDVFNFTPDDIRANRQRRLSRRQRRRLWGRFIGTLLGGLVLMSVPVLLGLALISLETGISPRAALEDNRAIVGLLIGGLLGVLYALANWPSLLLLVDLIDGRVRSVRAPARLWGHYLLLGDERFVVGDDLDGLVRDGVRYRAFVLPLSKTLLSLEFAD